MEINVQVYVQVHETPMHMSHYRSQELGKDPEGGG